MGGWGGGGGADAERSLSLSLLHGNPDQAGGDQGTAVHSFQHTPHVALHRYPNGLAQILGMPIRDIPIDETCGMRTCSHVDTVAGQNPRQTPVGIGGLSTRRASSIPAGATEFCPSILHCTSLAEWMAQKMSKLYIYH